MDRYFRPIFLGLVMLLFLASACPALYAANDSHRVLFISSYHPAFLTFPRQLEGVRSVLEERSVTLDIEFMDSKRFGERENLENFHRSLTYKLARCSPYEAIITGDDNALTFALAHQHDLFARIPIVFMGLNNEDLALRQDSNPLVTGVVESLSLRANLALMKRLQPQIDQVIALVDGTPTGQTEQALFLAQQAAFPDLYLAPLSLADLSYEEFATRLRQLGEESAVLLLSAYRDKNGRALLFEESLALIKANLGRPLFYIGYCGMGSGILGGKLISQYEQGRVAAEMVRDILHGRAVATMRVRRDSPNRYVFDWREIERFGIDPRKLPRESLLLYRPPSFYQKYRMLCWFGLGIAAGTLIFMAFWLLTRRVRQRYQKALGASERRYRAVVEDQTELICRSLPDGTLTFVNDALCRFVGQSRAELIGQSFWPLVPEDEVATARRMVASLGAGHPVVNHECRDLTADGEYRWHQWRLRAIADDSGRMVELQAVGRDITEYKQAEDKLRAAHRQLQDIVEFLPDATFVLDRDRRVMAWNRATEEMTGVPKDAVLGKTGYVCGKAFYAVARPALIDLVVAGDEDKGESLYNKIERRGEVLIGEAFSPTIWNGRGGCLWGIAAPLYDHKGQRVGAIESIRDISDRKKAEQDMQKALDEAEEARERVDAILESVADGLIVADLHCRIILMNRAAEKMLGRRLEDVFLKPVDTVINDAGLVAQLLAVRAGDREKSVVELELACAGEGKVLAVQAVLSVMRGRDGMDAGVITLLRDVSRERELDRMKREFISTAAHELRTPLTAVMGFSELLLNRKEFDERQQDEFLAIIHKKAEVLGKIVNDMLDLARVDSGQVIRLHKDRADVASIVARCTADYQRAAAGHRFETSLPEEPVVALVDDRKLFQVMENLLSNAVKFSPEGSLVRVLCERLSDEVRIAVADEGIGMTSDQASHVFDKFYRGDASDSGREGLGLGMAIVKSIVEAHGGCIRVTSKLGRGTTIALSIPLQENPMGPPAGTPPKDFPPVSG